MSEHLHRQENLPTRRLSLEKLGALAAFAESQETNLHSAQLDNRFAKMVISRMDRN